MCHHSCHIIRTIFSAFSIRTFEPFLLQFTLFTWIMNTVTSMQPEWPFCVCYASSLCKATAELQTFSNHPNLEWRSLVNLSTSVLYMEEGTKLVCRKSKLVCGKSKGSPKWGLSLTLISLSFFNQRDKQTSVSLYDTGRGIHWKLKSFRQRNYD